jgi:hypothetical protein
MATSVKQMMAEANAAVPRIAPAEASALIARGEAVVLDVRDAVEVRSSRPTPSCPPTTRPSTGPGR